MDVFRQFLAHGDPIITSAFRARAFVRATTACWTTIYHRLRVKAGKKQYWPLHNMVLQLQEWSAFDGLSPLKSMRQSIQGGLLSIFMEIVYHHVGSESAAGDGLLQSSLEAFGAWIIPYAAYPSVVNAMTKAWASLEEKIILSIAKMKENEKAKPWLILDTRLRLSQSRLTELPSPKVCDNVKVCAPSAP
ncbi:hypothetical protein FA13DRAFT_1008549 [Coprinellus micaceus]|uniref:Uncharacterized protein n=1 Tax=Coprinellus micaceus TaxID=71717 RepID=A0A4Y7SZR0_COPMI|nr:hypothetical protein FA13DRAFT_1008549 [Coprinellus micaceus]